MSPLIWTKLEWRTLVTGDRLDDIITCSWQGLISVFDFTSRPALGPTQLPVTRIQTSLPLREGGEEGGMEVITECPSNSKFWSASIYTSNSSKRLRDVFLKPGSAFYVFHRPSQRRFFLSTQSIIFMCHGKWWIAITSFLLWTPVTKRTFFVVQIDRFPPLVMMDRRIVSFSWIFR